MVTWFLLWLLLFTFAYTVFYIITQGKSNLFSNKPLPTLSMQFAFGLLLGLLQGSIALAQDGDWIIWGFLKVQWAYLPSHCCFFCFGILAKKNDWLTQMSQRSSRDNYVVTGLALVAATALSLLEIFHDELSIPVLSILWGFSSAMMNLTFPKVMLIVFEGYLNISNKLTRFMSRAAYATYFLHFHFVLALSWVWAIAVTMMGYDALEDTYALEDTWVLAAGIVFLSVVGLPLTWSLCWCICQIPGVRDIV